MNVLKTMITRLQDEKACALEVNALEAGESAQIRTVLEEPNEVKQKRQKELSALKEWASRRQWKDVGFAETSMVA